MLDATTAAAAAAAAAAATATGAADHAFSVWDLVTERLVAQVLGMCTSVLFTVLYWPQFLLNWRRKSTKGFSGLGICIKLLGASFLAVNAWFTGEALPVVAYGALNVLQHDLFMVQFFQYEKRHNWRYLACLLMPVVPYLLWRWVPSSVVVTNYFKPVSQVLSHVPQLLECARLRSTKGVSLLSQHLNLVGGVVGIYMNVVIPPRSVTAWLLYVNSIGQALTLYAAYLWFDTNLLRKLSVPPLLPVSSSDHGTSPLWKHGISRV